MTNYKILTVSNNGVIDYSQLDGHRPLAVYVTGHSSYHSDFFYTAITIGDIWATHDIMSWSDQNKSDKATKEYTTNITIVYNDAQGYCTIGGSGLYMPSTFTVYCFY